MKLHAEMTPEKILEQMRGDMEGDLRKMNADGTGFARVSVAEQLHAQARLQQLVAQLGRVRFVCVGCEDPVLATDAACCECGGFVCPACRRTETEGECHHERPDFPGDAEDEA